MAILDLGGEAESARPRTSRAMERRVGGRRRLDGGDVHLQHRHPDQRAGLGAFGGSLHILAPTARRVLLAAMGTVLAAAVLESVIDDLSEGFGLESVADWMYFVRGGLTVGGAIRLNVPRCVHNGIDPHVPLMTCTP